MDKIVSHHHKDKHMRRGTALIVGLLFAGLACADDVPDPQKTPGAFRAGLTTEKICATKWGKDERHVTAAMKNQVFALYGYSGNDDPKCVPAGKRGAFKQTTPKLHRILRRSTPGRPSARIWTSQF